MGHYGRYIPKINIDGNIRYTSYYHDDAGNLWRLTHSGSITKDGRALRFSGRLADVPGRLHWINAPFYLMGDPVNSYNARQYCLQVGCRGQ